MLLGVAAADWVAKGFLGKKKEQKDQGKEKDRLKSQEREIEKRKVRVAFLMEKYGKRWRDKMFRGEQ